MSKNPNFKSNNNGDNNNYNNDNDNDGFIMMMRIMTMMLMMRHAEGAITRRDAQGMSIINLGGRMELDIQSRAEISGSEKIASHDVHGCSSLNSFK